MSARTVLPPVSTKADGIHDALPHPRDPAHSARESSSASQNPQSQLQGATEMKDLCVWGGVFFFLYASVFLIYQVTAIVRVWLLRQ